MGLSPSARAWLADGTAWEWQGHRIHVHRAGTAGPTLLLIHGYPVGSFDWHTLWQPLAERCRVLAPDLLGLGASDKPRAASYRLHEHAQMLDELLLHEGIGPVHVVAHDLGVSVAQAMLARREQHPRLPPIRSLTFFNGGLCPQAYRPRPIQRLLASPIGAWLGPRLPQRSFDRAVTRLFAPSATPTQQMLDDFWFFVTLNDGLAVAHRVGAFWRERLASADALVGATLRFAGPLHLINGALDPNSGRHMVQAYQRLQPAVRVSWMDDAGHWPQIEQPRRAVDALLAGLPERLNPT